MISSKWSDDVAQRQVLVDVLAHLERRLEVEGERRDDAQRAEPDDGAVERVAVAFARETSRSRRRRVTTSSAETAVGQVAVPVARAVGRGRARAGHRDVRQRGEVVQGEAGRVERPGELAVADAAVDGRLCRPPRSSSNDARHQAQRHQIAGGVGDVVERVAGAERPQRSACPGRSPGAPRSTPARGGAGE